MSLKQLLINKIDRLVSQGYIIKNDIGLNNFKRMQIGDICMAKVPVYNHIDIFERYLSVNSVDIEVDNIEIINHIRESDFDDVWNHLNKKHSIQLNEKSQKINEKIIKYLES